MLFEPYFFFFKCYIHTGLNKQLDCIPFAEQQFCLKGIKGPSQIEACWVQWLKPITARGHWLPSIQVFRRSSAKDHLQRHQHFVCPAVEWLPDSYVTETANQLSDMAEHKSDKCCKLWGAWTDDWGESWSRCEPLMALRMLMMFHYWNVPRCVGRQRRAQCVERQLLSEEVRTGKVWKVLS